METEKVIVARFRSKCACGTWCRPGQFILWDPDDRKTKRCPSCEPNLKHKDEDHAYVWSPDGPECNICGFVHTTVSEDDYENHPDPEAQNDLLEAIYGDDEIFHDKW